MTPNKHKPLEVEPIAGERMVFWVHSETVPDRHKYRVDLLAWGGMGQCSCKSWRTRAWPKIRDKKLTPFEWPCGDKHVEAARQHVLLASLRDLAKKEEGPCPASIT